MPAESEAQRRAAGLALAAKRGEVPVNQLRGAAKSMHDSMNEKQLRDFARKGLGADSAAAMVWSYSLRSLNVSDLRPLGRRLWAALKRGFPHVEAALKQGETEKGEPFDDRVWKEWRNIPVGLEPE